MWRIIAIAHLFMLGELTYALFKFTHTLLKLNDAKCLRDNKHVTGSPASESAIVSGS